MDIMDESVNNVYFDSYEDIKVHDAMLRDNVRMKAYINAIENNKSYFEGKYVLDVGAGTGILSLICARVGAAKVYAVEANAVLAQLCTRVVKDNNLEEKIQVCHGDIETIELPSKVDVIVSEFMGHYLIHEGMLESVLSARRFLKDEGKIFPEKCFLYAAFCDMNKMYDNWSHLYGFDMSSVSQVYRRALSSNPQIINIDKETIISKPELIASFDLYNAQPCNLNNITTEMFTLASRDGTVSGLCVWFTVEFPSDDCSNCVLSTSPFDPVTHWKQTLILFPNEYNVEANYALSCKIVFKKTNRRKYLIDLELLDSDLIDHPIPCDCSLTKCIVAKEYFLSSWD